MKFYSILAASSFLFPVLADTVVSFAPDTVYRVNGVADIQPVTGVVCNGSSEMKHVKETRALNLTSSRLYLWVYPHLGRLPADVTKKMTRYERLGLILKYNTPEDIRMCFDRNLGTGPFAFNHDGSQNPQFAQLEQLAAWHAEKNIVLHLMQSEPRTKEDFEPMARYYINVIREIKRRYPSLEIKYVMFYNEPNYTYPREFDQNFTESRKLFFDCFNHIRKQMKKEVPETTLIGPGLCFSSFSSWYGWENWTLPFLKAVPDAEEYNHHTYTTSFAYVNAWTSMLQAASLRINGRRIPTVVTEFNVDLFGPPDGKKRFEPETHVDRVRYETEMLFGHMRHPDLFKIKTYFYYHYTGNYFDMWLKQADGTFKPAPVYWMFRLLNDLRGTRVFAQTDSEQSPVRVIASDNGTNTVVALFNASASPCVVVLKPLVPLSPAAEVLLQRYAYDKNIKNFRFISKKEKGIPSTLTLAPFEVLKMSVPRASAPQKEVEEIEYYAKETGVPVSEKELCIRIPNPVLKKSARGETILRIAFHIENILKTDRVNWQLNGHRMGADFIYEGESRKEAKPILYVEKMIPEKWLKETNEIRVEASPGAPIRMMFASLTAKPSVPGCGPVKALPMNRTSDAEVGLSLRLPDFLKPGINQIEVGYPDGNKRLTLELPSGWNYVLNGKSSCQITVPAEEHGGVKYITAVLRDSSGKLIRKIRRGTVFYHPYSAVFMKTPEILNGNAEIWKNAQKFTRRYSYSGYHYNTAMQIGWNEKDFLVRLDVRGAPLKVVTNREYWFHGTALELFFDFGKEKFSLRNHQTMQSGIFVVSNDGKCEVLNIPHHPDKYPLPKYTPDGVRSKMTKTEDGFILEAIFPWETLWKNQWSTKSDRWIPNPGMILPGFDAAFFNYPALGAPEKNFTDPRVWHPLYLSDTRNPVKFPDYDLPADSREELRFAEKENSDWNLHGKGMKSERGFLLFNRQSCLTSKKGISSPGTGKKHPVRACVVLNRFQAEENDGKPFRSEVRIAIAPQDLGSYFEPYSMKKTICLRIVYEEAEKKLTAYFSKKEKENEGFGGILWEGTAKDVKFPLMLTIELGETNFFINAPSFSTSGGSSSGFLKLEGDAWKNPFRFGIKSMTGNKSGSVEIGEITFSNKGKDQ